MPKSKGHPTDLAWRHLFVPGAGSEGVPKVCNIKMSHNAIPTIPLYQRTPYNQWLRVQSELGDTFLCLKLEVRVGAQKS